MSNVLTSDIFESLAQLFDHRRDHRDELGDGKPLPDPLRAIVEDRLSELGYVLNRGVKLVGVSELEGARVQDIQSEIVFDRRSLKGKSFGLDIVLYDIPFVVVYRPACDVLSRELSGHPKARDLAAYALALHSLFLEAKNKGGYLESRPNAEEYRELADLEIVELLPEIRKAFPDFVNDSGEEIAREIIHRFNNRRYPENDVHVTQVTHTALAPVLGSDAFQWVSDRFGWSGEEGYLLPLQIGALGKGIASDLLDHCGLITGPTSSGKTFVTEMRILARWSRKDHDRRQSVMLVPTKEIGIERAEELRIAYGYDAADTKSNKLRVVYSDGDNGSEDYQIWRGDFDLAILVNEKFRYFQQSSDFLKGVGEIIVDEMEMIGKGSRGQYLELLLTSVIATQKEVAITCLSRPFSNTYDLLGFLKREDREPYLVEALRRPFPIEIGVWEPNSQTIVYTDCNDFSVVEERLELHYPGDILGTLKGILIAFLKKTEEEAADGLRNNLVLATPTKRNNLQIAEFIGELYRTDDEIRRIIDENTNSQFITDRLTALEPSQRKQILSSLLPNGIGVHDADLSPHERLTVSRAFRDREIPILITTQTMAYGVNLPAQAIVFLGWGTRPMTVSREVQYDQYVVKLQDDFITWLGRVGRFGQNNHRKARAIYLCAGGKRSEEYQRISALVRNPLAPIYPTLAHSLSSEDTMLYVLRSLQQRIGGSVTWDEIEEFYTGIYAATQQPYMAEQALMGLLQVGGLKFSDDFLKFEETIKQIDWPERHVLEPVVDRMASVIPQRKANAMDQLLSNTLGALDKSGPDLVALRELSDDAGFRALFLVRDESALFCGVDMDRTSEGLIFETNRLGNIACGFGVATETVRVLAGWLDESADYKTSWHILDMLAVIRGTPDGDRILNLRPQKEFYDQIREAFQARIAQIVENDAFGTQWVMRSPLMKLNVGNVHLMATLLALQDWQMGIRIYPQTGSDDIGIETCYGLAPYGSNIRDRAKDCGRILRVMEAIASAMPKLSEEERENGESDDEEINRVRDPHQFVLPQDIPILVDELQQGMPFDAVDLGRTGIEGLSRTWALDLFDKMEEEGFEPDLPVLERLRLFTEEEAFFEAVPTPGLGQRIKKELNEKPRSPISERLRHNPDEIRDFYAHETVANFQLAQGFARYTALKVNHRRAYAVMRRNISKRNPIVIEDKQQFDDWASRNAVEFLSEIGFMLNGKYYLDRFLVDLDPRNDFSLDKLKALAIEIGHRLENHAWVDIVYYHWTGGKGFHIVGEFKEGVYQGAEQVKRVLERMADRLSDDVTMFTEEQPYLLQPYVVMDLKPVMRRGLYRNSLSLNSNTGGVCVPLTARAMEGFSPVRDATIESVLNMIRSEDAEKLKKPLIYSRLVEEFSNLLMAYMNREFSQV